MDPTLDKDLKVDKVTEYMLLGDISLISDFS